MSKKAPDVDRMSGDIPALTKALSHREPRVRRGAAEVLGEYGARPNYFDSDRLAHERAIAPLRDALASEDAGVQWRAARALGDCGETAAPAIPKLIAALESPDDIVRTEAAAALGKLKDESAVAPLQDISGSDRNELVRRAAQSALEGIARGDLADTEQMADELRGALGRGLLASAVARPMALASKVPPASEVPPGALFVILVESNSEADAITRVLSADGAPGWKVLLWPESGRGGDGFHALDAAHLHSTQEYVPDVEAVQEPAILLMLPSQLSPLRENERLWARVWEIDWSLGAVGEASNSTSSPDA